jgi:dolichyl-phosphate beta-glucosyltransferase
MHDRPWIVIPCYNEAARLDRAAFEAVMEAWDSPVFVFVDDGSTDSTLPLLEAMRQQTSDRCRVLALPENRGKAEAVRHGLNAAMAAGATRMGYWDADLATPLAAIDDFCRELDDRPGIEVVMGCRVKMLGREIRRSAFRHYVGRVYATLASLVLRVPVYDTQCGAKLFRRSPALEGALAAPFRSRWAFDVELLQRLQIHWGDTGVKRIVEVPLREWRDVGKSKVSLWSGARAYVFLLGQVLRRPANFYHESAPVPPQESSAVPVAERLPRQPPMAPRL